MKKATPILLTLSLLINVALGALLYVGTGVLVPAENEENLSEIRAAGTYGPEGMRVVEGDATISAAGVVLQNTLITGNLLLTEGIGDGSLQLKNVMVKGTMLVNGGGEASILLEDVVLEDMVVNRPDKKVRIVAKGNSTIKNVVLETGALLEEDILGEGAKGFMTISIETAEEVNLAGDFTETVLLAEKARLIVKLGKVDMLLAKETAKDAYIEFSEEAAAGKIELRTAVEVAGLGVLDELEIRGLGLRKLAGHMGSILVGGQGIFVEFAQGRADNLTVDPSEGTVSIQIPEGFVVGKMELNGKASVTGKGTIENVIINENGTTIDQTPGKVELAQGITALVGGKELPEQVATPEPKPTTPKVSINKISGQTLGAPGTTLNTTKTVNVTVTPTNASISASSNNTGVAKVSVSGKTLTITALKAGTATISVTGKSSGYTDRTVTFKVTVIGPTAVRSFTIGELTVGKKVVVVKIYASNPQNYNVFLKGLPMAYLADQKSFYIEVPEGDAKQSNVKVYAK